MISMNAFFHFPNREGFSGGIWLKIHFSFFDSTMNVQRIEILIIEAKLLPHKFLIYVVQYGTL